MNKVWMVLIVFLVLGGVLIYEQTSEPRVFGLRYFGWIGHVAGNVKDVTGHAVEDYTWLPNRNATPPSISGKSRGFEKSQSSDNRLQGDLSNKTGL